MDVGGWLRGLGLGECEEQFRDNKIDADLLPRLTVDDLKAENAKSLHLVDTADLDAAVPVPHDIPWFPKNLDAWSVRWVILHVINELTRHSGHADIIRESIDGATMYELLAGLEDWEIAGWVTPWKPQQEPTKNADS